MSKASVVCYTVPAFIASITAGLIIALTDSQSNSNICGSPGELVINVKVSDLICMNVVLFNLISMFSFFILDR